MNFPLDLWDISLLFAVIAIILLVSSELLSSYYGKIDIFINKKKLRVAALASAIVFLITAALRVITIILMS